MWRALLLVLVCGCSRTVGVYVDARESADLIDAVHASVEAWNAELGADLLTVRSMHGAAVGYADLFSVVVRTRDELPHAPSEGADARTTSLVLVTHISVRSSAVSDRPFAALQWLVQHELGHALGLAHVDDPANLMSASAEYEREGFALTRTQLRRARAVAGARGAL